MSEAFRAPKSFGIAGVLGEGCRIYHSAGFSTCDIGRVSDLLAAKMRETDFDELRLRTLILLGSFEALHAQQKDESAKIDSPSESPVSLECGLDALRIAVGFSFLFSGSTSFNEIALKDRIKENTPQGVLETVLCDLYRSADSIVVRYKASMRQIEMICILELSGPPSEKEIRIISLAEEVQETPAAHEYVELGDLDYDTLLEANRKIPKAAKETPSGAIQRPGMKANELTTVVKGSPTEEEGEFRIQGAREEEDNFKTTISGETQEARGQYEESLLRYKSQIISLNTELERLKSERRLAASGVEESSGGNSLKKLLAKLLPSNEKTSVSEENQGDSEPESKEQHLGENEEKNPTQEKEEDEQDLVKISEKLLTQIDTGEFGQKIKRAQNEIDEINAELGSVKARRWVESLLVTLAVEKKNLYDHADKLTSQIRFKENDFRNRERILIEQAEKNEQGLRQKTIALTHTKAQLNQLSEMLKGAKLGDRAAADDLKYKQNMTVAQRSAKAARDEAGQLRAKVEEMRLKLLTISVSQKVKENPSSELTNLKNRYDRTLKQVVEMKIVNQGLLDKLNSTKGQSGGATNEDIRKRLDAAMKLVIRGKTEAKDLQEKLDEAKKQGLALKMENACLGVALKAKSKQLEKEVAASLKKNSDEGKAA